MAKYAYCKVCKKQIDNPIRKPLETFQKVVWVIIIVATVGIAALVYAIYVSNKKKNYCPTCLSALEFSKEPFEKEEEELVPLTPKEKVLSKAGKKVERKEKPSEEEAEIEEERIKPEQTFCPYCGEDIKPNAKKCPYCGSNLKTPY
ncbi:MAG: zinc ribbon domain-containing protein [Candidatus Heimdallarchaeota archaeon]